MTTKYGFGINFEQVLTQNIVAHARSGWNNGKTESWAYTEVDQTFQLGAGFAGRYLSYGGLGLILGDGGLT